MSPITTSKMSNFRWVICALLFIATTVNYMDRQVLSLTWKEMCIRDSLRLQVVIEHSLEGGHLRIHDHDVAGDAVLAQCNLSLRHI